MKSIKVIATWMLFIIVLGVILAHARGFVAGENAFFTALDTVLRKLYTVTGTQS